MAARRPCGRTMSYGDVGCHPGAPQRAPVRRPADRPGGPRAHLRGRSAGKGQPWDFVVVTDRAQLTELAKVWERGGGHIARSAATIALVAREPEDERSRGLMLYDFGQATAYMMLAAADLGIGSGH